MDKKQILNKFSDFVSIQSVSSDTKRHGEILNAVKFIIKELDNMGFKTKIYQKNNCPPLIIAKKIISVKARNLAFYAHYDIQPEDPVNQWKSPPFKLTIKNNKIWGRGVADDKGHLIEILFAAKKIIKEQSLNNNLVFIFEGEEETGSDNFETLIKNDVTLKNVDAFYVVDMGIKDKDTPQIYYGLRGVTGFELIIKTSDTDLHSGVYGNKALNPAQLLANLMSKMKEGAGWRVTIPGFYDEIKVVSEEEKKILLKSSKNIDTKIQPGLDINGMVSGFIGEGSKTIIPAKAMVKFSIRLVPGQDHKKIEKLVEKFIKENLPPKVQYSLDILSGSDAFYTDYKNYYAQKTSKILETEFKNKTAFNRSGGSVAAAEILQRLYKKPVILIGFTLPDDNIHAPNENFDEETFFKGITAIEKIMTQ